MATAPTLRLSESSKQYRPVHRFSVDQYENMALIGFLTAEDRVELLEGVIVDKMTQNPPHNVAIDLVRDALQDLLPKGWRLREQKAIRLKKSEPEPDLAVVRGPVTRYAKRHPVASDVAASIEVSDSSLSDDRERKGRIYARAGIPVYWIVNLVNRQVEVYTEPKGGRKPSYQECQNYGPGESIPVTIAGKQVGTVAVDDLLPPEEGDKA